MEIRYARNIADIRWMLSICPSYQVGETTRRGRSRDYLVLQGFDISAWGPDQFKYHSFDMSLGVLGNMSATCIEW